MGSIYGKIFQISTFGESHGAAVGVVVTGCPAGVNFDMDFIQSELDRRKPGQSRITTQRKEADSVEVVSGVFEGKTTGTPIAMLVWNGDQRSKDYSHISDQFRPSHADYTYQEKYGLRDYRGGGRSSARETVARVAAGALAKLVLQQLGVKITAYVSQVGTLKLATPVEQLDLSVAETNAVRCPDAKLAEEMFTYIDEIRKQGDSVGGVVSAYITGCPVGLGEPVFDKLHAELGKAMLSINAVKGFEYGSGFEGACTLGSQNNDAITKNFSTHTNNAGGILGGISTGDQIYFNVAFKPVATILKPQQSIDRAGNAITLQNEGRHDPCVLPRAVPIVEAMAALVMIDMLLQQKAIQ